MQAGEKKKAKEIAKNMKVKGIDIETISELTGLSITEIKRIKIKKK